MEWLQSAKKLVDRFTLAKGAFWRFTDFRKENKGFLPSSPLRNVVPLFEVSVENTKHPKFGMGGVWIVLFPEVTLSEYNISTILSPILVK